MIITQKNSWFHLLFSIRGSTFQNIWHRLLAVVLIAVVVTAVSHAGYLRGTLTPVPFTVVGLALAIFLGFRNNAAYDRYWEGRKLWGALVNVTRNFAIQSRVLISTDDSSNVRPILVRGVIGYVNCLRHRLRASSPEEELNTYLEKEVVAKLMTHKNVPVGVLDHLTELIVEQWRSGNLETYQLVALQADLSKMLDVQGGCERIQSTPIPFTYSVLTHRTVSLYCLGLPFGLHDIVGWATPLVVGFISYAFLALDDLGDELQQPFGLQPNSLPLHSISRTIEINLLQLIGTSSEQLPLPIVAKDEILV